MRTKESVVLVLSFLLTSVVGVAFVYGYWSHRHLELRGLSGAAVFVFAMTLLHALGAWALIAQGSPVSGGPIPFDGHLSVPVWPGSNSISVDITEPSLVMCSIFNTEKCGAPCSFQAPL